MAMHESGQMYLEAIYVLLQKNDKIRAIDVGAYSFNLSRSPRKFAMSTNKPYAVSGDILKNSLSRMRPLPNVSLAWSELSIRSIILWILFLPEADLPLHM